MDVQQYQDWLDRREAILEALVSELDEASRAALDFTPASLRGEGALLLARFASLPELHRPESRAVHLGLSTYTFEVFRRNLELVPRLPAEERGYEYNGVPVLRLARGPDISPFDLVTFTVHRRAAALCAEVYASTWETYACARAVAGTGTGAPLEVVLARIVGSRAPMSDEEWQSWLDSRARRLRAGLSLMKTAARRPFDSSPRSLEHVGATLVADPFMAAAAGARFDVLVTYIGEVFHRHLGLAYVRLPDGQPGLVRPSGEVLPLWNLVLETAALGAPDRVLAAFEQARR